MSLTFLRRKGLGGGSIKGMTAYLTGVAPEAVSVLAHITDGVCVIRNDKLASASGVAVKDSTDWLVRWGCTTHFGLCNANTINISEAISEVSQKQAFRKTISKVQPELAPKTIFSLSEANDVQYPIVLRPTTHAQGKNLWLVNSPSELANTTVQQPSLVGGWYASEYVEKVAEYRVYVVSGRVVTVANKTPDDPKAVAWNVAQGGKFDVVKFGAWNLDVLQCAVDAFSHTKLDFGGVDIMVDKDGRAYLIEINSSPSLPIMVEGKVSYRQQCMAKAIKYITENGKDRMACGVGNWKVYIHPAISDKAVL